MVDQAIALHGHVDALINNAGLDEPPGRAWELGPEHWIDVIDTNLSGQWWCTMAVLPHMLARRTGRIVFISSVSARRASRSGSVAYNASKAGLIGLTIALSAQVETGGVLVNAIAPGPTGTGNIMTSSQLKAYEALYPLGVVGPEPVAHACGYLIGPGGDWLSGTVLNVSGGGWRG
jgi:NAD(P)-dependent dehydrogenase (short-subunit alcohol dehydrogenase family)